MSLTKGARREKLLTQLMVFRSVPDLPPDLLDLNLERSRDEVARRYMFTEEWRFRKSVSVSNGDALPADFILFANEAYRTSDGTALSIIEPPLIGSRTNNAFGSAQNTSGSVLFGDGRVYLYPSATIGACTMHYYTRQPHMVLQADSTQDGMPPDTEDAIVAGGVIRTLQMLVEEKEKFQLDKAQVASITDSLKTFQMTYFTSQNEDPTLK